MDEKKALISLFRKLGAPEAERWADSQATDGIDQVARYLFLRQAWRNVVPEGDASWIVEQITDAEADPAGPHAGAGEALQALRRLGASDDDLTDLVRGMQSQLLFSLCYQLEDPGELEPEVGDVAWGLFRLDEDGNPGEAIIGLHESVLETDPTGREMRPRPKAG